MLTSPRGLVHKPPLKRVEGFTREVYFLVQPHRNRPAEFARTSLPAWGLPTPIVALACIGNVDIQVFSCADGRLYFIRRLQVYLFIIFHVQPISQGVTLLFFFAEKKKRSKKRKEFAFHLYCKIQVSPEDITFSINKNPPAGHTGGLPAVTLPFLQLKLGRKVGGDPPPALTFFLVHAIIFLENRLLERRCCIC